MASRQKDGSPIRWHTQSKAEMNAGSCAYESSRTKPRQNETSNCHCWMIFFAMRIAALAGAMMSWWMVELERHTHTSCSPRPHGLAMCLGYARSF